MEEQKEIDSKTIKQIILSRRAESFLFPYFTKLNPYMDEEGLKLRGIITVYGKQYSLIIPLDKTLKRVMKRLEVIEPAVIGKKINIEDVKLLLLLLYAPFKLLAEIYPMYKKDIKRVIGLTVSKRKMKSEGNENKISAYEKKLLNLAVFKKVAGRKLVLGIFKKKL